MISYKLLGTKEWFVIHHTDCGMALFTDTIIRGLLKSSLETAQIDDEGWKDVGQGPGSTAGDFVNWLAFSDETSSVIDDVSRIRITRWFLGRYRFTATCMMFAREN